MYSSRQALQTNGKYFSNIKIIVELLTESKKIFMRLVRRQFWSNPIVSMFHALHHSDWDYKSYENCIFLKIIFALGIDACEDVMHSPNVIVY